MLVDDIHLFGDDSAVNPWFLFSLMTLLCWGAGDVFSKLTSKPGDPYSHLRIVMAVGLAMGAYATVVLLTMDEPFALAHIARYLPISALYILSMTLGYVGLRYLAVSVSSPLCNTSGAFVTVLYVVFNGAVLTGMQALAIFLICAGMVALGVLERRDNLRSQPEGRQRKYTVGAVAVALPVLYAVLDALGTYFDGLVLEGDTPILTENQGVVAYGYTFLLCAVLAFVFVHIIKKDPIRNTLRVYKTGGAAAILETAGEATYVYALAADPRLSAPVISTYAIVSVLLSRVFLKEKLRPLQYVAIAVVMSGVIILGVLEGLDA